MIPPRPPSGGSSVFRFGAFELDAGRRRLTRAGTHVSLMPKPMSLLILLLRNPGELVAKEDIVSELWGGDAVTDASVFQVAGLLRKALGTAPGGGEYLDRHGRGGYRLVVPVETVGTRAPQEDPDSALAQHLAFVEGWVALESLDTVAVERAYRASVAALSRDPDFGPAHVGRANARMLMREAVRTDGVPDMDLMLREAEHHAHRGCALLPASAGAWSTLALVKHQRGCTLEAVAAMRKALTIDPVDWRLELRLAWVSWGEERLAAARRVLAAMPGQPLAHWFAATVYVARGLFDQARNELRAGCASQDLQLAPGSAGVLRYTAAGLHWLHGLILYAQGEDDDALEELAREIAFEDGGQLYAREAGANSWYARGVIHARAGRAEEARDAFEQALRRVARHPMARLHVADAPGSASERDESAPSADRLDALLSMAGRLVMSHQHADAARLCTHALRLAPPGSAGWWLPVEPTLRASAQPETWAESLATLRARAM